MTPNEAVAAVAAEVERLGCQLWQVDVEGAGRVRFAVPGTWSPVAGFVEVSGEHDTLDLLKRLHIDPPPPKPGKQP